METKRQPMTDDEFLRHYEAYENETAEDSLRQHSRTDAELRETIAFLIRHREMMRDVELQKLQSESQKMIEKLKEMDRRKLLEELACFKDMLVLQRELLKQEDISKKREFSRDDF